MRKRSQGQSQIRIRHLESVVLGVGPGPVYACQVPQLCTVPSARQFGLLCHRSRPGSAGNHSTAEESKCSIPGESHGSSQGSLILNLSEHS